MNIHLSFLKDKECMKHISTTCLITVFGLFCTGLVLGLTFPQEAYATSSAQPSKLSVSTVKVKKIIEEVFGPRYAQAAKQVAFCESRFNSRAYNRSSGAAGVFQFLLGTWKTTRQKHHSRFDAQANIKAAHEVFVRDGHSWREWQCKP